MSALPFGSRMKTFWHPLSRTNHVGVFVWVFLPEPDHRNPLRIFYAMPSGLQLAPIWGISPRHQNSHCQRELTPLLHFTLWWAFTAPLQGMVRGIDWPAVLTAGSQDHLRVSVVVFWLLATATLMKLKWFTIFL